MNVREIVKAWLQKHGYDGLFYPAGGCACLVDDLGPCCESCLDCEAGYKWLGDEEYDFYVRPTRPEGKEEGDGQGNDG